MRKTEFGAGPEEGAGEEEGWGQNNGDGLARTEKEMAMRKEVKPE